MKKKVKKYVLPTITVARRPTIYLEEVKEWKESTESRVCQKETRRRHECFANKIIRKEMR